MRQSAPFSKICYSLQLSELSLNIEGLESRIYSCLTQLFLYAEKLIIFSNTLASGRCSCLNLAGIQCYCKICDSCIFCLAGTVGRNCCVTCFVCHLDCFKSLRYRSNLIQFDQNRISASKLNSFRQSLCVCDKKIISNQLNFISQLCCQLFPAFPVFLIKCIFCLLYTSDAADE